MTLDCSHNELTNQNTINSENNMPNKIERTRKTGVLEQPKIHGLSSIYDHTISISEESSKLSTNNSALNVKPYISEQIYTNENITDKKNQNSAVENVVEVKTEIREHTKARTDVRSKSTPTMHTPSTDQIENRNNQKRMSTGIPIPDEIRRMSMTVIKNIFKKSKTFTDPDRRRHRNSIDPVVPNFIFRYHAETDIDNVLPKSEKAGYLRQTYLTTAVSLNTLISGVALGMTFPLKSTLTEIPFLRNEPQLAFLSIWIKYFFLIGSLFSCFIWWEVIFYAGRKLTSLLSSLIFLVSFSLIFLLPNPKFILLSYSLVGIASTSCFVNSYFYIPECIEDRMKNISSVFFISLLFLGIYMFSIVIISLGFNTLIFCSIFLSMVAFTTVLFVPESPVYYIMRNKLNDARRSITWFKHRDNEILVSYEITLLLSKFTEKYKTFNKFCFFYKPHLNALYMSLIMVVGAALNTTLYFYLNGLIVELFSKNLTPFTIISIVYFVPIVLLYCSVPILEKSKRKTVLAINYALVTTSIVFLSIFFNFLTHNNEEENVNQFYLYWILLACFLLFSVNSIICSFVIPHIIFYEIFSTESLRVSCAILYIVYYCIIVLLMLSFPYLESIIGIGPLLFPCALIFLVIIKILHVYLPETKDDPFTQVLKKFRRLRATSRRKKVSIFTIGDPENE